MLLETSPALRAPSLHNTLVFRPLPCCDPPMLNPNGVLPTILFDICSGISPTATCGLPPTASSTPPRHASSSSTRYLLDNPYLHVFCRARVRLTPFYSLPYESPRPVLLCLFFAPRATSSLAKFH